MSGTSIRVEVRNNLQPLMGFFFDNRRELLDQALDHCRTRHLDALRAIGHNFKGSCGGYGFHELSRLGAELEQAEDLDEACELVARMRRHLESVEVVYV